MDFTREVLAQYEDVRRDGRCNMLDNQCVKRLARLKGHASLVRVINQGRYHELVSQYDGGEAAAAHDDFDFSGGGL